MACMWLAGLAGASPAYADVDEQVKQSTIDALTVKGRHGFLCDSHGCLYLRHGTFKVCRSGYGCSP